MKIENYDPQPIYITFCWFGCPRIKVWRTTSITHSSTKIRIPEAMRNYNRYLSCAFLLLLGNTVHAFVPTTTSDAARTPTTSLLEASSNSDHDDATVHRRFFLNTALVGMATIVVSPQPSFAAKRYILDDETGEYIEQDDEGNWQAEWKSRYDQMQTMTKDEIFMAARGAGNTNQKDLENESLASKKRRAFSGCRDKPTRAKLGNIDEKSCTKRVLEGDLNFVLDAL